MRGISGKNAINLHGFQWISIYFTGTAHEFSQTASRQKRNQWISCCNKVQSIDYRWHGMCLKTFEVYFHYCLNFHFNHKSNKQNRDFVSNILQLVFILLIFIFESHTIFFLTNGFIFKTEWLRMSLRYWQFHTSYTMFMIRFDGETLVERKEREREKEQQ